jgi:DNA-binding HxlR family transcriptional regulator
MCHDLIISALSDRPMTQKELRQQLHVESGVLSHRLNSLMRKGLIERKTLEIRYRPFGYARKAGHVAGSDIMRWPKI